VQHQEVACFFQGCTLFALSSRAEPFGLVILEAAYYRKAVVCTAVGGVPEIVTDGVNGVLVESEDSTGMAEAIVALIRDQNRREQLGARAYDTLLKRFLWKDRIGDYIAVYEGRPVALAQPATADLSPPSVPPTEGDTNARFGGFVKRA
jgi:glycosyltransferase involved in cell wall biosynthesis